MIDLMILFLLLKRDLTMYSIHKRIGEMFLPYSTPSFGALKPALVRLEKKACLSASKIMSDGGKLSVYYSITKDGMRELKRLLLLPFSKNPLQFISDARVKLSCASFLGQEERAQMYLDIKTCAMLHKVNAEKVLEDEYTPKDFYQRIVLDNTICEFKNFISLVEGLEKENAGGSK